MFVDIIGYIAGILTLINMLPQVMKSYKTKSVEDVSFLMVLSFTLSMLLWVIYAIFINSWPIIITNSIAFVISVMQIGLMARYKKK